MTRQQTTSALLRMFHAFSRDLAGTMYLLVDGEMCMGKKKRRTMSMWGQQARGVDSRQKEEKYRSMNCELKFLHF